MGFLTGTVLLAVVTAVACALPGVFIVLRKNSMLVDAISHAVLPGIVAGYFFSRSLDSPLLAAGAAVAGLLVVAGSEYLSRTGLIAGDAPQGLIFPALFSAGVILVSLEFQNVHLDEHTVLAGDFNLAAFHHIHIGGVSIGPGYLYLMLAVLVINALFLALTYRRLESTTFDAEFARSVGIRAGLLNTIFMFLVSFTITSAFHAAGAILVIALIVAPAASALLLTNRLPRVIALTVVIAVLSALAGFWLAYFLDAATSAGMALFCGLVFLTAFGFSRLRARGSGRTLGSAPTLQGGAAASGQPAR